MRVVIQRVSTSKVQVDNEVVGQIGPGLLVLLGISRFDDEKDAQEQAWNKYGNYRFCSRFAQKAD